MDRGYLSLETKKIRKTLLIFSAIGFTVSRMGLTINKISVFGSELTATNVEVIPLVVCLIVLYYLISFVIMGFHEYSDSYRSAREEQIERIANGKIYSPEQLNLLIASNLDEINTIKLKIQKSPSFPERQELEKKIDELYSVNKKHDIISRYLKTTKIPLIERLNFNSIKIFVDVVLPVIIGIIVIIMLFFFTHIPNVSKSVTQNNIAVKPNSINICDQKIIDSLNSNKSIKNVDREKIK